MAKRILRRKRQSVNLVQIVVFGVAGFVLYKAIYPDKKATGGVKPPITVVPPVSSVPNYAVTGTRLKHITV